MDATFGDHCSMTWWWWPSLLRSTKELSLRYSASEMVVVEMCCHLLAPTSPPPLDRHLHKERHQHLATESTTYCWCFILKTDTHSRSHFTLSQWRWLTNLVMSLNAVELAGRQWSEHLGTLLYSANPKFVDKPVVVAGSEYCSLIKFVRLHLLS